MARPPKKDRPGPGRNKLRADRVVQFIAGLTVPSGFGQGKPFVLRPWQVKFVRDIYEPTVSAKDMSRVVRRAVLSIARKNGKTALIAALALCHLVGPESIMNGEVYSAANSRDQAGQIFKVAAQMVRLDPELSSLLRVVDSTKTIACYRNGSFYRAISADAGIQHGLNPSFAVYDELAQAKNRDLYDVLDTSMGAREEPLFAIISTQSNDPEHILSQLIDDGMSSEDPTTVCHLYAVPDEVENIFDPSVWKLANPALGDFRSLPDMEAIANKAKRIPSEENKFRNLYLNQRVSPNSSLISKREWMACVGDVKFVDGEEVYLALDLSSVNDLSALAMASADDKTRLKVWMWKPEETLREHSNRDFGHGNWRYEEWHNAGYLEVTPGKVIHHGTIAAKIIELCKTYRVIGLAYDRHKIEYLMRELDALDFLAYPESSKNARDGLKLVPWGQGYVSMGPAIDALETAIINRDLVHPNNPALNWNFANAVAVMDPAGNRKLDKDKARFRIDGAQAAAMVVGYKYRDMVADTGLNDFIKNAVMS